MSKKDIKHQADLLRRSGRFDPAAVAPVSALEQLRALDQEGRTERAFNSASTCDYCERERRQSGDATALCETHLSAALGF